jgi:predicted DNA-binding protein
MAIAKKALVGVRLGPRMKQVAEKRAASMEKTLSEYIRELIEKDLRESAMIK